MMTTNMDKLRRHSRVELVDDERGSGNGVIVTLKAGWTFDLLHDNRVSGEDTPALALAAVKMARAYTGPLEN